MHPVTCPRCRVVYAPTADWAGVTFACSACGNPVNVPQTGITTKSVSPFAGFEGDDGEPLPATRSVSRRRAATIYQSRVKVDETAGMKAGFGSISIVAAVVAFILTGLAMSAPLIQANSYVVPGICLAVVGLGVAIVGVVKVNGFSMLLTTGFLLSFLAIAVGALSAMAINERWAEVSRTLRQF